MSLLNLENTGGGSYIRFLPSINGWKAGGDEITLTEITFDLDSVQTGYMRIEEGMAPESVWSPVAGQRIAHPGEGFKPGFSIMCIVDDEVREWATNGTGAVMGFSDWYDDTVPNRPGGSIPHCKYTGADPIKVGKGNTRKPRFEVIEWVTRPSMLSVLDDDGAESWTD